MREREGGRKGGREGGRERQGETETEREDLRKDFKLSKINFRYHKNCYTDFASKYQIKAAKNQYDLTSTDKTPFNYVLRSIRNEEDRIWNSCELLDAYIEKGGTKSNVTRFLSRIQEYLKDEIYWFKSPGVATIIMHKTKAINLQKLISNQDEDETLETEKVAKQIKSEVKDVHGITDKYPVLDDDTTAYSILPTLNDLLVAISPKFKTNQKAVALISSIVTSMASSKVSMLHVALGLKVREKKTVEYLQEYGVTSSYDEVRRFKISSAYHASQKNNVMLDSQNGLIQGVSDNVDANLSTQNGLNQTHSLASVILQHRKVPQEDKREPIPRLKKCELVSAKLKSLR